MNKWSFFLLIISLVPTTFRAMEDPNPPTQTAVSQPEVAQSFVNSFQCPGCTEAPMKYRDLLAHMKENHINRSENTATCAIPSCGEKYSDDDENLLRRHLQFHIKLPIICVYCSDKFENSITYSTHCRNHHKDMASPERLKCSLKGCRTTSRFPHILEIHTILHHQQDANILTNLSTQEQSKLPESSNNDINTTAGSSRKRKRSTQSVQNATQVQEKRYKCHYKGCNMSFKRTNQLDAHIETHTKPGFFCEICSTKCPTRAALYKHKSRYHKKDNNSNQSYDSEEPEEEEENNQTENVTQLQDKSLICQYEDCGKSFKRNCDLTRHIKTHNKVKYTCPICSIVYVSKRIFDKHVPKCPKKFEDLQKHISNYNDRNAASTNRPDQMIQQEEQTPFAIVPDVATVSSTTSNNAAQIVDSYAHNLSNMPPAISSVVNREEEEEEGPQPDHNPNNNTQYQDLETDLIGLLLTLNSKNN